MARKKSTLCSFRKCYKPRLVGTKWCSEHYRVKQYENEITMSKPVMSDLFNKIEMLKDWNVKSAGFILGMVSALKSTNRINLIIDPKDRENAWMLLFEAEKWAKSLDTDSEDLYDECRYTIYPDGGD